MSVIDLLGKGITLKMQERKRKREQDKLKE
jgi:hypothetical protein